MNRVMMWVSWGMTGLCAGGAIVRAVQGAGTGWILALAAGIWAFNGLLFREAQKGDAR